MREEFKEKAEMIMIRFRVKRNRKANEMREKDKGEKKGMEG